MGHVSQFSGKRTGIALPIGSDARDLDPALGGPGYAENALGSEIRVKLVELPFPLLMWGEVLREEQEKNV